MWFLVWFQLMNGQLDYYQLGWYDSERECRDAREKAVVLMTTNNSAVECFEVNRKKK